MLETCELLLARSLWSVGSGTSVRILEDRWLHRLRTFRITASLARWRRDALVRSIMTTDGSKWGESVVRALFPQSEANSILAVPLRGLEVVGHVVWYFDTKGCFTVRSAYRLGLDLDCAIGEASSKSLAGRFSGTP
ncbi:UNVERIFIED_CONTAM: hypothetical protein Slati_0183400, partial [Sesamum latifolium]